MEYSSLSHRSTRPGPVLDRNNDDAFSHSAAEKHPKQAKPNRLLWQMLILTILSLASFFIYSSRISQKTRHLALPPIRDLRIDTLQKLMGDGRVSSVDLVETYLERIKEVNPKVNAVCEVNKDALGLAQALDIERAGKGPRGVLHGIPIFVKDTISVAGMNNTAGSFCLAGSSTKHEASLIHRLRNAGAIILGKANLSQWGNSRSSAKAQSNGWSAWGGQTYGVFHDAQDPCGSSSGSAVLLALGLAAASIGVEER